jgi:hypothetical protein
MANYDLGVAVGGTNQQIADAIKGVVDSGQTSSQIANMLQNPIANDALPPYVFTSIENMQLGYTVNGLYVNDYLTVGQSIKLTDATRHGDFTVRLAADYTAEIAVDTLKGVYVPITGTDYVAVRDIVDNTVYTSFYGATGSGDDYEAVQGACNWVGNVVFSYNHHVSNTVIINNYNTVVDFNKKELRATGDFPCMQIKKGSQVRNVVLATDGDPSMETTKGLVLGKYHSDTFANIGDATNLTLDVNHVEFNTVFYSGLYSEIELDNTKIDYVRSFAEGDWGDAVIDLRGENPIDGSRSVNLKVGRVHLINRPTLDKSLTPKVGVRIKSTEQALVEGVINGFDIQVDAKTKNPAVTYGTFFQNMDLTLKLHKDETYSGTTTRVASTAYVVGDTYTLPANRFSAGRPVGYVFTCTVSGASGASLPSFTTDGTEFTDGTTNFKATSFECCVLVGDSQRLKLVDSYLSGNTAVFVNDSVDFSSVEILGGEINYSKGIIYNKTANTTGVFKAGGNAWLYGDIVDNNSTVLIDAGCTIASNSIIPNGRITTPYRNNAFREITTSSTVSIPQVVFVKSLTTNITITLNRDTLKEGDEITIINTSATYSVTVVNSDSSTFGNGSTSKTLPVNSSMKFYLGYYETPYGA